MSIMHDRVVHISSVDPEVLLERIQANDFARFLQSGLSDLLPKEISHSFRNIMQSDNHYDVLVELHDSENKRYTVAAMLSVKSEGSQINETTELTCDVCPNDTRGRMGFGSVRIYGTLQELSEDFLYEIECMRYFDMGEDFSHLGDSPFSKRRSSASCFLDIDNNGQ